MANAPANGATSGTGAQNPPGPGSLFGVPKYSTQRRFVPDNGNNNLGVLQTQGSQMIVPTTRLDQLDIVVGEKLYIDLVDVWTEGIAPNTLTISPWYHRTSFSN
jgi:hypothetical protein